MALAIETHDLTYRAGKNFELREVSLNAAYFRDLEDGYAAERLQTFGAALAGIRRPVGA